MKGEKKFKFKNVGDKIRKVNQFHVILVLVGIILGLLLGMIIFNNVKNNLEKKAEETETVESDTSNITTYTYESTILKGTDADEAREIIQKNFDYIRSKNAYFEVQVSDSDYNTYIYNTNGEIFTYLSVYGSASIFRNDGSVIEYNNTDGLGVSDNGIDYLTLLEDIVKATATDTEGITFYEMTLSDAEEGQHEYRIDLVGDEAIKQIYSSLGDEDAEYMVESLKSSIGEEWEPHLIYSYIINSESEMTNVSYVIYENEEYVNWASYQFLELPDWSLDDTWYTTDFETEDIDVIYEMFENTFTFMESLLQQYADENGIELVTSDETSTETTEEDVEATEETTEVETVEATETTESTN